MRSSDNGAPLGSNTPIILKGVAWRCCYRRNLPTAKTKDAIYRFICRLRTPPPFATLNLYQFPPKKELMRIRMQFSLLAGSVSTLSCFMTCDVLIVVTPRRLGRKKHLKSNAVGPRIQHVIHTYIQFGRNVICPWTFFFLYVNENVVALNSASLRVPASVGPILLITYSYDSYMSIHHVLFSACERKVTLLNSSTV